MKIPRRLFLFLLPFQVLFRSELPAAETSPGAAGYWEGAVSLPNTELGIRVEITRGSDAAWQATIDIPLQGLRGFKLDPVSVEGAAVAFALPGIPGDPKFAGRLADDGATISGDFTQGGGTMPFKLERKAKPAKKVEDETPAAGIPGKGLAGNWRGSLKPLPGIELRLALELTQAGASKPEGVLVSLDQGNSRIPITTLMEKEGAVNFETASIGGVFDGKLNADGSEIAGDWKQGGRTMPLVFKRTGKAPSGN